MAAPAPVPAPGLIKSSTVAIAPTELSTNIPGASCANKFTDVAPINALPAVIKLPLVVLPVTVKLPSVPTAVKLELTMFDVSVLPVKNSAGAAILAVAATVS